MPIFSRGESKQKLTILFYMKAAGTLLTREQLYRAMIENGCMEFFDFQVTVNELEEAIERRQDTISNIAQAIFDAQPGFFAEGLRGLKPLTMQDIAAKVGVHHTTVSRTVNDKYVSTPKGTVELRKFFTQGFVDRNGEQVAKDAVAEKIRGYIDREDKAKPLSDEKIAQLLKADGLDIARRTVAKYRLSLDIPGTAARRSV